MKKTKKIHFENFVWLNIQNPDKDDIEHLREEYGFHPLDIKECLTRSQRGKADTYEEYGFVIMLFPVYNRNTRQITAGQTKFFISQKYLITIHYSEFGTLNEFWRLFEISDELRSKFKDGSPERLLYELFNRMFLYCFPMIDHLITDCDAIDEAIFSHREHKMIEEILVIRRNITDFRKIMQVHKNVLKKLVAYFKESHLYVMKKTDIYYENLVDYTKDIWDTLENLKERIEALQDSNESQISFKLSHIMKTLTVISVFTFPLTLIATIFAMDLPAMPFKNNPYGFWYALGFLFSIFILMYAIFKKNRWF